MSRDFCKKHNIWYLFLKNSYRLLFFEDKSFLIHWDNTAILQTWGQFRDRSHKCRISEMKTAGPQKKMSSDRPAVLFCVNLWRSLWRLCCRSRKNILCIDSAECGTCRRLTESLFRLCFKWSRYVCSHHPYENQPSGASFLRKFSRDTDFCWHAMPFVV